MDDRMRRWRAAVAAGQADAALESIARAAARSPGQNVEASLELSDFVLSYAALLERPDEEAPIARWRRLGKTG